MSAPFVLRSNTTDGGARFHLKDFIISAAANARQLQEARIFGQRRARRGRGLELEIPTWALVHLKRAIWSKLGNMGRLMETTFLSAAKVLDVLYGFDQNAYGPSGPIKVEALPLYRSVEEAVMARLRTDTTWSLQDLMEMGKAEQRLIRELLGQYVMFLAIFNDMRFPVDFLDGSSGDTLGEPVLRYIAKRSWPFPQLLAH